MSGKVKPNHDANQVHLGSFTNWRNGGTEFGQLAEWKLADWTNDDSLQSLHELLRAPSHVRNSVPALNFATDVDADF